MRPLPRALLAGALAIGVGQALAAGSARAQGVGRGGSLGGYGGSMGVGSGMGMGGPILPYAGRFGGFMPYRMGSGGGELAFERRSSTAMSPVRTSYGLPSMSRGMGQGLAGPPMTSGALGGTGLGGGMRPSMPGGRGMGVMPPSFAYPFRQPPSLLSPNGPGAGMSM